MVRTKKKKIVCFKKKKPICITTKTSKWDMSAFQADSLLPRLVSVFIWVKPLIPVTSFNRFTKAISAYCVPDCLVSFQTKITGIDFNDFQWVKHLVAYFMGCMQFKEHFLWDSCHLTSDT